MSKMITEARRLPRALRDTGKVALRAGWKIRSTGSKHLLWLSPDGASMVLTSSSPSDPRALSNSRSDFRRAGLHV